MRWTDPVALIHDQINFFLLPFHIPFDYRIVPGTQPNTESKWDRAGANGLVTSHTIVFMS